MAFQCRPCCTLNSHFASPVMGIWCQPGGLHWLGSHQYSLFTHMKGKREWTVPKRSIMGWCLRKHSWKTLKDIKKTSLFPSLFCFCQPPFPLSVRPTKLGTQQSEKRKKEKPSPSKSSSRFIISQIKFMLTDGPFHWKLYSLPGVCG